MAAGLWSGRLLTVTTPAPGFAAGDGRAFARDLGRFLPVARTSPTNYILVVLLLVRRSSLSTGRPTTSVTSAPTAGTSAGSQPGITR